MTTLTQAQKDALALAVGGVVFVATGPMALGYKLATRVGLGLVGAVVTNAALPPATVTTTAGPTVLTPGATAAPASLLSSLTNKLKALV